MSKSLIQKLVPLGFILMVPLLLILASASGADAAPEVKKSKSGVCHCPGGQFYDRTSNYTAFDSIDACMASGGHPPKRGQGDCSAVSSDRPVDKPPASQSPNHHDQDPSGETATQKVKKSKSGVCHCPGGQFYDRTSNYTVFDSIDACMASGGRPPKRGQGDCSTVSPDRPVDKPPASQSPNHHDQGPPSETATQKVKKSKSGICHCPGGQFYDRTSNYTAFDSIDACMASGGRPPKHGQGDCSAVSPDRPAEKSPASQPPIAAYDRNTFGGWADEDEDCQNTRHERLITLSTSPPIFSEDGCYVMQGQWSDPYTGESHTTAQSLEVDHLVPLHYAWMRGASHWQAEKKQRFMNDPANLLVVEASVNRTKGAAGPLEWLPPASGFHCEYLLRFARVTTRYDLAHTLEESAAIESLTAEKCDQG